MPKQKERRDGLRTHKKKSRCHRIRRRKQWRVTSLSEPHYRTERYRVVTVCKQGKPYPQTRSRRGHLMGPKVVLCRIQAHGPYYLVSISELMKRNMP